MMWSDSISDWCQIWRTGRRDWFASLFILMEKITLVRSFGFYSLNKIKKTVNFSEGCPAKFKFIPVRKLSF